jgi:hypothetical protein
MSYFKNRTLLIATNHQKDLVLAPIFEKFLFVKCVTSNQINTDLFGTFSGEVERINSAEITLREKSKYAYEKTNIDLVLTSEGSFGPHPLIPFATLNEEWLLLKDFKNNIEIKEKLYSQNTNFSNVKISNTKDLVSFAKQIGFPNHALIFKDFESDSKTTIKGIHRLQDLKKYYYEFKNQFGTFFAETDMRAMYNPTRMHEIYKLGLKLLNKMVSLCPKCEFPGFGITDLTFGLPCEDCLMPSKSILSHIFECQACHFKLERMYPKGKKFEEPMYCEFCNP